jgi:hypothetical protein
MRWCESIEAVPADLATKVQSPTLGKTEDVRDAMLEIATAPPPTNG